MTTPKKKPRTSINIDEVNWRDHVRAGSKFSKELEPEMLSDNCKKVSKGVNGVTFVEYDRAYVKAKIAHTIFSRLGLGSYEEYENLFKESWEFYQSGEYEMLK